MDKQTSLLFAFYMSLIATSGKPTQQTKKQHQELTKTNRCVDLICPSLRCVRNTHEPKAQLPPPLIKSTFVLPKSAIKYVSSTTVKRQRLPLYTMSTVKVCVAYEYLISGLLLCGETGDSRIYYAAFQRSNADESRVVGLSYVTLCVTFGKCINQQSLQVGFGPIFFVLVKYIWIDLHECPKCIQ